MNLPPLRRDLLAIVFAPGRGPADLAALLRRLPGLRYQARGVGESHARRLRPGRRGADEFEPLQLPVWEGEPPREPGPAGRLGPPTAVAYVPLQGGRVDPRLLARLRAHPAVMTAGRVRRARIDRVRVSRPVLAFRVGDRRAWPAVLDALRLDPRQLQGPFAIGDLEPAPIRFDGEDDRPRRAGPIGVLWYQRSVTLYRGDPGQPDVDDLAAELGELPGVRWAMPLDAVLPGQHAGDFLKDFEWHHGVIGSADAWTHAASGAPVTLAVADLGGIDSAAALAAHPDFARRIAGLYDFERGVADNDEARVADQNGHGIMVAGVAAAGGEGFGTRGLASEAEVIGARLPVDLEQQVGIYPWLAGLLPSGPSPSKAADVVVSSVGVAEGSALSALEADVLAQVALRGRQGRGTVLVFSAGNGQTSTRLEAPLCASPYTIGVGAAEIELDPGGPIARHAPMSNVGDVDLVAPGRGAEAAYRLLPSSWYAPDALAPSRGLLGFEAKWSRPTPGGPILLTLVGGVRAARISRQVVMGSPCLVDGTLIGRVVSTGNPIKIDVLRGGTAGFGNIVTVAMACRLLGRLKDAAAVGATQLEIGPLQMGMSAFAGLIGRRIVVGQPATDPGDQLEVEFTGFDAAAQTIDVTPLARPRAAGALIYLAARGSTTTFGDTSAAAPQVAGVAALMLRANPELTALEVGHLLRESARAMSGGADAVGAGLLQAGDAVRAAVKYGGRRDLYLRKTATDPGDGSVRSIADSPDVWIRAVDPATDPGDTMVHADPVDGRAAWIRVEVRNRGTAASLDGVVRAYVCAVDDIEAPWPAAWPWHNATTPVTPPGPWLIGDASVSAVPGGGSAIVDIGWPTAARPASIDATAALAVLVEVLPVDGAGGPTVRQNPHLAVRRFDLRASAPTPAPTPAPRVWIYDAGAASGPTRLLDLEAIELDRRLDPAGEVRVVTGGSAPVDVEVAAGAPLPTLPPTNGPSALSQALSARAAVDARGEWTLLGAGGDDPGLALFRSARPGETHWLPGPGAGGVTLHAMCSAPGPAVVGLVEGTDGGRHWGGEAAWLPATGRAAALGRAVIARYAARRGLTRTPDSQGPFTVAAGTARAVFVSTGPLWFRLTAPDGTVYAPVHTRLTSYVAVDAPQPGAWQLTTLAHGAVALVG